MKICVIGKYPPIEGGVSSRNYWLMRALGDRGHKIFVVTNAWAIEDWIREQITKEDLPFLEPKNIRLFSLKKEDYNSIFNFNQDENKKCTPSITKDATYSSDSRNFFPSSPKKIRKITHILNTDYGIANLTGMAADITNKYDLDIIFTHYLLPYGVAGLFLKKLVSKPLIVRHATSDFFRLYNLPFLTTIFSEIFRNADGIIAYNKTKQVLTKKGIPTNNVKDMGIQEPDLNYFNPKVKPFDLSRLGIEKDVPVFSYFGKISQMKKTYQFVDALSKLKNEDYRALFVVGNGLSVQELKHYIHSKGISNKCVLIPFQPPWKIPSIMRASTCIVAPENYEINLPIDTHLPQIANEAAACGKCSIVGEGVSQRGYYKDKKHGEHFLVVRPEDIKDFSKKLNWIIKNPSAVEDIGKNAYNFAKRHGKNEFIDRIENIFASCIFKKTV